MTPAKDSARASEQATRPAASVVIPCYNAEKWVARAIQSVLDQPGVEPEVTVIDDGSTDGSLEVIRGFGERIRWATGPNRGACAARNRGLELAQAEYVLFLDADDYLEGAYLSGAVESLISSGADLAFGNVAVEVNGKRRICPPLVFTDEQDAIIKIVKDPGIITTGVIWRKEFLNCAGRWLDGLRGHQDVEVLVRACDSGAKGVTSSQGHLVYFQHKTPGRISKRVDADTERDRIKVILAMRDILHRRGIRAADANALLHARVDNLLKRCARHGTRDAYRAAYDLWRQCGALPPRESRVHLLASRLLGIRAKEKLWLLLRGNRLRRRRALQARD